MNLTSEQYGCYALCICGSKSLEEALDKRDRKIFSYSAPMVRIVWEKTKNWIRPEPATRQGCVNELVQYFQASGLGFVAKENLIDMVRKIVDNGANKI